MKLGRTSRLVLLIGVFIIAFASLGIARSRLHVFSYSPRPGTLAAHLPNQVKNKIKKERSQWMVALAEERAHNFSRQFLGKTVMVLWEKQSGGIWSGHTDNYLKVYTRSSEDLTNKLLPVKLVEEYPSR